MLELTGMSKVLHGIALRYRLPVIAAVLALRNYAGACRRMAIKLFAIALCGLLPACAASTAPNQPDEAYAKAAWAYFKNKCDTEAGEKIYRTFTGVKSVLVVKPLPPASDKDHFDQYWYGDPYSASAHSQRGKYEAAILASPNAPISFGIGGRGFDFVEVVVGRKDKENKTLVKYFYVTGHGDQLQQPIDRPISRFSISWEDISTPEDRNYWVAGSRLRVFDLVDKSVIAERIGYILEARFGSTIGQRRPWLTSRGPNTTCPQIVNGNFEDRWFILKVLNPSEKKQNGK